MSTTANLGITKLSSNSPDYQAANLGGLFDAAMDTLDTAVAARQLNGQDTVTLAAADGAVEISGGTVVITKASAAALTLAAPAAGTDDGKIIRFISNTAAAHTVTTPANKIQDGTTTTKDTATFDAHPGASFVIEAYDGLWNLLSLNAVTLTEV